MLSIERQTFSNIAQDVNFDKQEVSSLHRMSAFLLRAFKPDIGYTLYIHNVLLNHVSVKRLARETEDCFEQATVVSLQHRGEVYSVIQYAGLLQSSLFMVSVSVH